MRTISMKTKISKDHKLIIDVPEDFPTGPAEIAGDMLKSPLFGIWKDRKDITDSLEFAKKLRKKTERINYG